MTVQTVVGDLFVALGVFLIGVAAIGLLRLPDVYNRANAVAKAASLGLVLVLLGVVVLTRAPRRIGTGRVEVAQRRVAKSVSMGVVGQRVLDD